MYLRKKVWNGLFDRSQKHGTELWNFWRLFGLSVTVQKLVGLCVWKLSLKSYVGMYETVNSYGNRFQKVKPRLDEWAARGQPTAGFRDC